MTNELTNVSERRQFRRVFSLVPEEDVVLFSMDGQSHFVAKLLDLSRGGALIYTARSPWDAAARVHVPGADRLGNAEHDGERRRRADGDGCRALHRGLRVGASTWRARRRQPVGGKLARMEIIAARLSVSH